MIWLIQRFLGTPTKPSAKSGATQQQKALGHIDTRLTNVEKRLNRYEVKVDARLAALEYKKDVISRERNTTGQ